jgi:hypothetical protein
VLRHGEERLLARVTVRAGREQAGEFAGAVVVLTNDTDSAYARIEVPFYGLCECAAA